MPITDADIRFRASERMTDFADGGGRMSAVVIVDGVDNNLFPDVTDIDRLTGRVSLRKVFAGVFSDDSDTFLSSHALLDVPPEDEETTAVIFSHGGLGAERDEAATAVEGGGPPGPFAGLYSDGIYGDLGVSASWTGAGDTLTLSRAFITTNNFWLGLEVGQVLSINVAGVRHLVTVAAALATVMNADAGVQTRDIETNEPLPGAGAQTGTVTLLRALNRPRCYGVATAPGTSSSGASAVTVDSTWARVIPVDLALPYPADNAAWNISGAGNFTYSHGRAPILWPGDAVLIHHTDPEAPQTVSNAQVVDVGRVNLARLRVIGSTGVEHARFTAGQPAPSGVGCTADLAAGTVTFTDVSGYAQPVVIEHRIEEMALATTVTLTSVGLNRTLSREYPAGTRVSSLLMLGDLQARAEAGFPQQAWTGVWADSVIGGSPIGDFNDAATPVVCTNEGGVTERWAVIFTNSTAFRVIGEALGEVGTGNTGTDFAPNNPATGAPYFTIPSIGWGSGWAAGNVWRFNSIGAQAPLWALRCVAPSMPTGDDSVTLQLRGYVNT